VASHFAARSIDRWWPHRSRRPKSARLYLKENCGLCDRALELLEPFQRDGRIVVERVDITSEPTLFRRYCFTIPVLELETGATLEWPFGETDVRRALR
jgi:hypothetical protein